MLPDQVAKHFSLDAKSLEEEGDENLFHNLVHLWCLVFSNLLTPVDVDDVESKHSSQPEEKK